MTTIYLSLIAVLALSANGCIERETKSNMIEISPTPSATTPKEDTAIVFGDLRKQALNVKPSDLGLKFSDNETSVYGVVMDWDMQEGVATLVVFSTGDASLYNSRGGGVIGGVGHDNVRTSSKNLTQTANRFLEKAKSTQATALPKKDFVGFYLLTNRGLFYLEENIEKFEKQTSPLFSLFEEANKVMTELIAVSGVT